MARHGTTDDRVRAALDGCGVAARDPLRCGLAIGASIKF